MCFFYSCSSLSPKHTNNETIDYFDLMAHGGLKADTINPQITKFKTIYDTSFCKINDTCVVNLIAYFNTGYLWKLLQNEDSLKYLGEKSKSIVIDSKNKDLQQFLFIARKPGAYKMLFTYKRPFEPDTSKKVSLHRTIILK